MKKGILFIVMVFVFSNIGFSQPDDPGCSQTFTVTDETCSGNDCSTLNGCVVSSPFSPTCTGTFSLCAWTECTGHCEHCAACVSVREEIGGALVAACNTLSECENNPAKCTNSTSVPLVAKTLYVLYVCLVPCPNNPGCQGCDSNNNCRAYGRVSNAFACP